MNIETTEIRIDGGKAPDTLIGRINAEEWVGANLSASSRTDYARRLLTLENQIKKNDGSDACITPQRITQHLKDLFAAKKIAQATARALKAATLFWLAEEAQALMADGSEGLAAYETAYTTIRGLATNELPKRTTQTSSPKLKSLPASALADLTRYSANTPRARNMGPLLAFLNANLLVGLRPEEWFDATFCTYIRLEQPSTCLAIVIKNAKATHGRANGSHREILLLDITQGDLAALMHFLEIIESFRAKSPDLTREAMAKAFFDPLQQTMRNAYKKLHYQRGTTPTLYSTRHQAVANAKASGLTDREIAAMFGHSSTSTAKSHYGKKMNGWSKTLFRPSVESLAGVPDKSLRTEIATPNDRVLRTAEEWMKSGGRDVA